MVSCAAFALPVMLALVSCSVKEDRTGCPCLLEVEFVEMDSIKDPVWIIGWQTAEVFRDNVITADYPERYTRRVPKGMLAFGAVEGLVTNNHSGHSVIIPEGYECDSLYAFSDYVDCTGERGHTAVTFHKQFATVNITVGGNAAVQGYAFVFESNSCGIDLLTCRAVEGKFRFEPDFTGSDSISFRIPRQCDDGLTLTVSHPSGDSSVFALGEYIRSIGYDWDATDLQDIYITLDVVRGRISIGVAEWEEAENKELSEIDL